jgi:heme-degrading monooxygenase HmoA
MFRVELCMDVRDGTEAEFEQAWLAVGRVVAEHPANLGQWFSRDAEVPGRYVIVSDWPDEESFRRFEKEPGHWELTGKLRALRKSGSMNTMTVLHHLAGAGAE